MVDPTDGNRVREYPQALLKQMQGLQVSPVYDGDDIFAMVRAKLFVRCIHVYYHPIL